ncbi:unnamed protein product [Larinioides sclopetarius]|uniref:Uncharacterized protein n=1 Tax=Larinioides sclopetarius TaxID=280406 RepID=A0AAV2BRY2_9ARAC
MGEHAPLVPLFSGNPLLYKEKKKEPCCLHDMKLFFVDLYVASSMLREQPLYFRKCN